MDSLALTPLSPFVLRVAKQRPLFVPRIAKQRPPFILSLAKRSLPFVLSVAKRSRRTPRASLSRLSKASFRRGG